MKEEQTEVLGVDLDSEHDAVYFYKGELFTGKAVEYSKAGLKLWEATFKDGLHNGLEQSWYDNGVIQSKQEFLRGEAHGYFYSWFRSGQLFIEAYAQLGTYLWEKRWSESGELVLWKEFNKGSQLYTSYMEQQQEARDT